VRRRSGGNVITANFIDHQLFVRTSIVAGATHADDDDAWAARSKAASFHAIFA
jgi:hypothetical protein